jgi:hypothetical protein
MLSKDVAEVQWLKYPEQQWTKLHAHSSSDTCLYRSVVIQRSSEQRTSKWHVKFTNGLQAENIFDRQEGGDSQPHIKRCIMSDGFHDSSGETEKDTVANNWADVIRRPRWERSRARGTLSSLLSTNSVAWVRVMLLKLEAWRIIWGILVFHWKICSAVMEIRWDRLALQLFSTIWMNATVKIK